MRKRLSLALVVLGAGAALAAPAQAVPLTAAPVTAASAGSTNTIGASCVRPRGACQPSAATAAMRRRCTRAAPCSRSSAGRTNISNEAATAPGLPGRPNTGVPSPIVPKACGLPGCIATRWKPTLPSGASV